MAQITQAMWQANLDALGPERANRWRERNGITVGNTVEDDEQETPGIAEAGYASAPATPSLGVPGMSGQQLDEMFNAQSGRLSQLYDDAASRLRERYQGPGTQDMLLALGAALLQPTEDGRLRSSLANIPAALLPYLQSKRQFANEMAGAENKIDMAKAQSLGDLQEKYLTAKAKGATPSAGTWSETLQRFIPKDRPVVLEAGSLGGKRTERMSDGSIRVYDSPGVFKTYDAGGNLIGGQ